MLKQWFKDHKITKALDESGKSLDLDEMEDGKMYFFHTNQLVCEQNKANWRSFVEGLMPKVEEPVKEGVDLSKMDRQELEDYCLEKYGVNLDRRYKPEGMIKKIIELGG